MLRIQSLILCATFFCSSLLWAQPYQVAAVALKGDPMPGGAPGEVIDSLSSFSCTDGERVLFYARGDHGNGGLFLWESNREVVLVQATGFPLEGALPGEVGVNINPILLDGNEWVGRVDGDLGTSALVRGDISNGSMTILLASGAQAPGSPPGVTISGISPWADAEGQLASSIAFLDPFQREAILGTEPSDFAFPIRSNDPLPGGEPGEVVQSALGIAVGSSSFSIWLSGSAGTEAIVEAPVGGAVRKSIASGDPFPGIPGETISGFGGGTAWPLARAGGKTAVKALGVEGSQGVLFGDPDAGFRTVARSGDPFPGGLTGEVVDELNYFRLLIVEDHVVLGAVGDQGTIGLFTAANPGELNEVVTSRTAVPARSGETFMALRTGRSDGGGPLIPFSGTGSGGTEGVFVAAPAPTAEAIPATRRLALAALFALLAATGFALLRRIE